MLSYEIMGALALAILWVNTLLIVAAAYKEMEALGALARRLRQIGPDGVGTGLVEGTCVEGAGEGGALAALRIEQVGRKARGKEPAIAFEDRPPKSSHVFGGAIAATGGSIAIEPPLGLVGLEVWAAEETVRAAAACPSAEAFDAALPEARKARGFVRTVALSIGVGTRVFVFGEVRRAEGRRMIGPAEDGTMLVSSVDPHSFCAEKGALCALFIVLVLAAAAGCTALALSDPRFGNLRKLGGLLGLGYFLVVQPAGVWLRGAVRRPSRAPLRGRWTRPVPAGTSIGLIHDRCSGLPCPEGDASRPPLIQAKPG
jgi:hypothetical protein